MTDAAYWHVAAFARSPGSQRPRTPTPMSAFSVLVVTPRTLDLTRGSLAQPPGRWTHPGDHVATQQLSADARRAGVAAIRAPSARGKTARAEEGINVAVLDPAVLVPPLRPRSSWTLLATGDGLLATREMSDEAMRFTPAESGM